jgi:hypothetical protein
MASRPESVALMNITLFDVYFEILLAVLAKHGIQPQPHLKERAKAMYERRMHETVNES